MFSMVPRGLARLDKKLERVHKEQNLGWLYLTDTDDYTPERKRSRRFAEFAARFGALVLTFLLMFFSIETGNLTNAFSLELLVFVLGFVFFLGVRRRDRNIIQAGLVGNAWGATAAILWSVFSAFQDNDSEVLVATFVFLYVVICITIIFGAWTTGTKVALSASKGNPWVAGGRLAEELSELGVDIPHQKGKGKGKHAKLGKGVTGSGQVYGRYMGDPDTILSEPLVVASLTEATASFKKRYYAAYKAETGKTLTDHTVFGTYWGAYKPQIMEILMENPGRPVDIGPFVRVAFNQTFGLGETSEY